MSKDEDLASEQCPMKGEHISALHLAACPVCNPNRTVPELNAAAGEARTSKQKASEKPLTRGSNPVGTGRMGCAHVSYSKIVEMFGEPTYRGDQGDSRVTFDWTITFSDGTVATIYDRKQSKLYDDDPEAFTPDEIKELPTFEWHIGGKSQHAVDLVMSALNRTGDQT